MRIIGLDIGTKTIGVAVSDELGWTAQPLRTIARKSDKAALEQLDEFISEYSPEKIVVGLPYHMNGSEGESVKMVREFSTLIHDRTTAEIVEWDERMTTVIAERVLREGKVRGKKKKKVIDTVAAAVILQGYLDYLSSRGAI